MYLPGRTTSSFMAAMTDDQLAAELQKVIDSARAGRCRSAAEARAEFKRRHAGGMATVSR
jgi:hypothetical protein